MALKGLSAEERFNLQTKKEDGKCWEWLGNHKRRYGSIWYGNKRMPAHKFSYFLHFGYMPKCKEYVCHKCDNTFCVNPDHLFLGNQKDNMLDMTRKGRHSNNKGEKNPNAKLSLEDVLEIKRLRKYGWTYRQLKNRFSIGNTQIGRIVKGFSWA